MPAASSFRMLACVLVCLASSRGIGAAAPCPADLRLHVAGDSPVLRYAAEELRRYARILFGAEWPDADAPSSAVVTIVSDDPGRGIPGLEAEDAFTLVPAAGGLEIRGANDRSALYGAYELVRTWGVQFYLSGDVLPLSASCTLPDLPVARRASFHLRGAHPYPDFLSGPSSWDAPQFEAYVRQLPKLGLNFLGVHQYTYEPYVDYEVDGRRPRSGQLETSATTWWGYGGIAPCEFEVGRRLFPGCVWGSRTALDARTPDERYASAQALLAGALDLAHRLGLVTAFGFEPTSPDPEFTALAASAAGRARLTAARIDGVLRAFPGLDYIWLFNEEAADLFPGRTRDAFALMADAEAHLHATAPGTRLMIGGWNLESRLRACDGGCDGLQFDATTVFTSYGNYDPWRTVRDDTAAQLAGLVHPHALAAWCEFDGRLLAGPQPNVTAYERLVPALRASGSLGFFLLHWNTRLCDASATYLGAIGWTDEVVPAARFYQAYLGGRFGVEGPAVERAVAAFLELERVNAAVALAPGEVPILANDWAPKAPWYRAALAVARIRLGLRLSASDRQAFRAQASFARRLLREGTGLRAAAAAVDRLAAVCARDCDHARFLANRVHFFAGYLREFARVSLALRHLAEADVRLAAGRRPGRALVRLARVIDVGAWRRIIRLYTRELDDRGELGVVVSLNQKVLAGLRALEHELARAAISEVAARPRSVQDRAGTSTTRRALAPGWPGTVHTSRLP
jgi:hypothetical protein